MRDETVLRFGGGRRDDTQPPPAAATPRATSCPTCGAHFSRDGRFCPFDGTLLVAASDRDSASDALLGTVVDQRYEVLSVIGEGGMGSVYCVRHRALGKRFALKVLRQDLALDGEIAARFIQEARTAAAVSHPGLVEITDFGRLESGQVYFVMELLEGQSLAALLRRGGPLPAARGLDIVRQLARALKAAHDASIVHRDLKPDNIHVGRGDGERDLVKIVDFGLAKVIGSSRFTRAGMVFGTPHYMSPEQAAGEAVDHRADIYALGVVMYEMFTGRVPFEADSYMGVLTKHMYMAPAPPSALCPELKSLGALEDIILRCLQKQPDARYESLGALLLDFDERLPQPSRVRGSPAASLLDQVELPPPNERLRRPSKLLPLAIIAVAFLLGLGFVFVLRRAEPVRERAMTSFPAPSVGASPSVGAPTSVAGRASVGAATTSAAAPARLEASPRPAPPTTQPSVERLPARKPAGAKTRGATASPAREPAPSQNPHLGSGEIVDPWAR